MTYQEATDFLFVQTPMFQNLGAGAYKPGLHTTLELAKAWGNPHKQLRCIHVGGTNGKGSTAHTIAAVLQSAGYRTGLYTSPHLVDFRERIRVNGVPVTEEFVVNFVERFLSDDALRALAPTFFELTTIMAFAWFVECGVDVAVIEVGLGGRLDCTNIIVPELSIITNISLDHTALLGHTEPEIAIEKAGIIKCGVPAVIGNAAGAVREVFCNKAVAVGAPIYFAGEENFFGEPWRDGEYTVYPGSSWGDIRAQLTGDCQVENAATIMCALRLLTPLFPAIDAVAVQSGFADVCGLTGLMGRWMTLPDKAVPTVCDTGHNIGGWRYLGPALCRLAAEGSLHVVLGFVNDKDVSAIMEQLPKKACYFFATPSVARGRAAESTAEIAREHGLEGEVYASVKEAYDAAVTVAKGTENPMVFVGEVLL